jgi:UPF0716 family protein affecting phage T7 exclusion
MGKYKAKKFSMLRAYSNYRTQPKMELSDSLAWFGTSLLMFGPYLMSYKIGFIMNALGIMLITPQVKKAKQWNLVILNVVSSTGYWLQIFNII